MAATGAESPVRAVQLLRAAVVQGVYALNLTQLATLLSAIHAGLGISHVSYSYFAAADADATLADVIAVTPIGHFLGVSGSQRMELGEGGLLNVGGMLGMILNLADGIWGLLSFEYGFLSAIGSENGLAYTVVLALRLVGGILWVQTGRAIWNEPVVTSLMSSSLGLALVGGTAGIGAALAAVGAVR